MNYVEIYKLENDGSQRVIATCTLVGGETQCEGDAGIVEALRREGIMNYTQEPPQKLFPKDGVRFLEQLRFNFKSGYLNASEVKEK